MLQSYLECKLQPKTIKKVNFYNRMRSTPASVPHLSELVVRGQVYCKNSAQTFSQFINDNGMVKESCLFPYQCNM